MKTNDCVNGTAIAITRVPVMYRLTGKNRQPMIIEVPGHEPPPKSG
jgi:hypothetical protein